MADETEPQQFPNFPLNITIKQEKASPKRNVVLDVPANGESSNGIFALNQEGEDSKGSLSLDPPPLKSSDEILAELFGVFNAAPPEILLGDGKHSKKKSKKEKKKKKIKEEPKSGGEGSADDSSDSESSDDFGVTDDGVKSKKAKKKKKKKKKSREGSVDSKGEKKHKKHKKHKIKKEKQSDAEVEEGEIRVKKEKSEESDRKKANLEKDVKGSKEDLRDLLKHRKHTSRDRSREPRKDRDIKEKPKIQIKSLVNSKILKDAIKAADDRHKGRDRDRKRKKSESDISLSDEDEGRSSSKRYRNPFSNPVKSEMSRSNRFYDGYYESYRHGRRRSRSRSYDRRRHRSRSRSGNRLDIDKKQLLEIARKNAIQMLKNGTLPGVQSLAQETKDKLMVKVKYGGKSVAELTDYCKKLSNGEIGDSDISDVESEVEERAFHHPFELKDREPIIMNIRNSVPIQPKSANEKKELLKLFPVSSGQEHRKTELEWVPVEPPPPTPVTAPSETKSSTAAIMPAPTAAPIVPLQNPQPQAPPKPIEPLPVPVPGASTTDAPILPLEPPPPPPTLPCANPQVDLEIANSWKSSDFGLAAPPAPVSQGVFNQPTQSMDVSQIITMRLDAMRRLQDNPGDLGAQRVLEDTQNNMSAWASSKYTPGQFLGSTGANLLSAKELAGWGNKAYAKKDTLTSTKPVDSGMGMHLLQKMGWRPGEGLGKDKSGSLQPLLLEVKNDRRGLVAGNENSRMKKAIKRPLRMNLEGKHPVSVLGEIAAKRKWGVPQFDVATEQGPGHAKLFVYKVRVNGMEYQPAIASNTKKEAKAVAAKFCLQQMGILPT